MQTDERSVFREISYGLRSATRAGAVRAARTNTYSLVPMKWHVSLARAAKARVNFARPGSVHGAGTSLRQKEDGTCDFGPQGCEVHAHRPLVCRLYPRRQVLSDGSEHYLQLEGHPLSEGEFHEQGTGLLPSYLESQVAKPFMAATDGYFKWLSWAHKQLDLAPAAGASKVGQGVDDVDLLIWTA